MKNTENIKIIICVAIVICIILVAVFYVPDMSNAKLEGYNQRTFEQTMDEYIDNEFSQFGNTVSNVSYKWKKGWSGKGAPNKSALDSGEKAMTFILTADTVNSRSGVLVFYFTYDREDNELIVQGGYTMTPYKTVEIMDKRTASSELKQIFKRYNKYEISRYMGW